MLLPELMCFPDRIRSPDRSKVLQHMNLIQNGGHIGVNSGILEKKWKLLYYIGIIYYMGIIYYIGSIYGSFRKEASERHS